MIIQSQSTLTPPLEVGDLVYEPYRVERSAGVSGPYKIAEVAYRRKRRGSADAVDSKFRWMVTLYFPREAPSFTPPNDIEELLWQPLASVLWFDALRFILISDYDSQHPEGPPR